MKVKIEKQPKSTLKISITVPATNVKEVYTQVLTDKAANASMAGFRKGQVPEKMVEEKTNPSELYGDVVNKLLEKYYVQALKEHKISPVSQPKVDVKDFDLEKDFEFDATVAIKPEVKIKEYKKELAKVYKKKLDEHKDTEAEIHLVPAEIIAVLAKKSDFEVSELLVEEEASRMYMKLLNQVTSLGMKFEDFLKAQNTTAEKLKDQYNAIAEDSVKAEFVLMHLIEEEKIEVSDEEINQAINAIGDEKAKAEMNTPLQRWYIKSVLAKNMLLTKIIAETEASVEKPKKGKKTEKKPAKKDK